jgi:hypothetical protein
MKHFTSIQCIHIAVESVKDAKYFYESFKVAQFFVRTSLIQKNGQKVKILVHSVDFKTVKFSIALLSTTVAVD